MKKPKQLDPLAEEILSALAANSASAEIVLGGYFALRHYLDYRATHDIDAWWRTRASRATEQAIEETMRAVAVAHGLEFNKRTFGDTMSFELLNAGARVFSFQIAIRSVELEPPVISPWPPIYIEALSDNIGAKMNALVDRGAPRDFTDIKRLVDAGLASIGDCWALWQRKNATVDGKSAREKVHLHLASIQSRRPLKNIADPAQRRDAEATRQWFATEFLMP